MKILGKIIYHIIILIIIFLIRNGIKVTYKGEIILHIHGKIIQTIFIAEILYETFEIFIPKIFKTIIKDIKGNQQKIID